jgi:hypothetical protein
MRICVIGNSHVAALKNAATLLELTELDFYAIPGAGAPDLLIDNGKVFADYDSARGVTYPNFKRGEWVSSNIPHVERDGLQLANYDCIFYAGLGLPALRKSNINTINQVICLPLYQGEFNELSLPMVSQHCFKSLVEDELNINASLNSLQRLIENYKGRILLQHFPLPCESILEQADFYYSKSTKITAFLEWYYRKQTKYVQNLIANYDNVEYLFDVFEHVDTTGFTQRQFGQANDGWHMNENYGKVVLNNLLTALNKA